MYISIYIHIYIYICICKYLTHIHNTVAQEEVGHVYIKVVDLSNAEITRVCVSVCVCVCV